LRRQRGREVLHPLETVSIKRTFVIPLLTDRKSLSRQTYQWFRQEIRTSRASSALPRLEPFRRRARAHVGFRFEPIDFLIDRAGRGAAICRDSDWRLAGGLFFAK
jgi:hypothetical protein